MMSLGSGGWMLMAEDGIKFWLWAAEDGRRRTGGGGGEQADLVWAVLAV